MTGINPGVPITIGGKERHMKMDLNAMIAFKHVTGKSFLKGFNFDDMDEEELRAFIWATLLKEEPTLTLEIVGGWIDENLAGAMQAANQAAADAMPEKKDNVVPNAGNLSTG
jgi:hypothetical protein